MNGSANNPPSPLNIRRFLSAQHDVYEDAVLQLKCGRKRAQWMWFVFPQLHGIGTSPMAKRYAITGLQTAREYMQHPVLGPRLVECTRIVHDLDRTTALQLFGTPDNMQFCSSWTLFEAASEPESAFAASLDRYYPAQRDPATLQLLQSIGVDRAPTGLIAR